MKYKLMSAVFFVCSGLSAQSFNEVKMDSLFTIIEQNQKGMGSVSIFLDGSEVYQYSIGYTNIEPKKEATGATEYRIGSISKVFTAALIMKLVEQGKLSLDTRLGDFYPQFEHADDITIEQLLRHRSGIYNFTSATDYISWMENPITRTELVDKIVAYGVVFDPDEKMEYSNSNYVLLSYIIEDVTGGSFTEALTSYILEPCNLKNTYYGGKINVDKKEANSYQWLSEWELATETDMSVPVGAGALVSTPTDLNNFLACLFGGKIVSDESAQLMINLKDGYGLGMFGVPFYDKQAYGHTGGIDGFQSNAFYFPDDKVSVAYLSNGVVTPINDIIIGVLSIYFGRAYELPTYTTATLVLTSEELDQYLGIYSSAGFPLKITITKKGNNLIAQATGQASFPLEPFEINQFKFDQAKLEIEFIPQENRLILRQGGGEFKLSKE